MLESITGLLTLSSLFSVFIVALVIYSFYNQRKFVSRFGSPWYMVERNGNKCATCESPVTMFAKRSGNFYCRECIPNNCIISNDKRTLPESILKLLKPQPNQNRKKENEE